MKRLANLRKELPTKSKLNTFQVKSLKGGVDKKRKRPSGDQVVVEVPTTGSGSTGS